MDQLSQDILIGADVIGEFLGLRRRQVYRAAEFGYLPHFRVGALICARRSTLQRWIEEQEASSTHPPSVEIPNDFSQTS